LVKRSEVDRGSQKITVYVLGQTEGPAVGVDTSVTVEGCIERCTATGGRTTTSEDIDKIRVALEADPWVGRLEGSITQLSPDSWNGKFERRDSASLVGFQATVLAGGRAMVLSLGRQTQKAKI
jgi:hypothetical protein